MTELPVRPGPGSIRSFIAVELGQEVRARLEDVVRHLRSCEADVRWARPAAMHLTLQFLGNVEPTRLERLHLAVVEALSEWQPFELEVRGVGGFPSLRRPRVLWAGVQAPPLVALANAIHSATEPLGFAREHEQFRGHVTLGRVRSASGWNKMQPLLDRYLDDVFGRCTIDRVVIFRSTLQRDGSVYTPLWEVVFGRTEG